MGLSASWNTESISRSDYHYGLTYVPHNLYHICALHDVADEAGFHQVVGSVSSDTVYHCGYPLGAEDVRAQPAVCSYNRDFLPRDIPVRA